MLCCNIRIGFLVCGSSELGGISEEELEIVREADAIYTKKTFLNVDKINGEVFTFCFIF